MLTCIFFLYTEENFRFLILYAISYPQTLRGNLFIHIDSKFSFVTECISSYSDLTKLLG